MIVAGQRLPILIGRSRGLRCGNNVWRDGETELKLDPYSGVTAGVRSKRGDRQDPGMGGTGMVLIYKVLGVSNSLAPGSGRGDPAHERRRSLFVI